MKTIEGLDVAGKRVLMRVDFNVPLAQGTVTDDTRIRAALPSIEYLIQRGAKLILMSHLGRPKGEGFEEAYSLAPVARVLSRSIGTDVRLAPTATGAAAADLARALLPGEVLILENLRFDPREKQNDPEFAQELASLADIYVDDAFGAAHRSHASVAAVAGLLPSYAGFLLAREVETLSGIIANPERPFVAIIGGSKVSDKIKVIDSLLDKVDSLLIGGAMCFTFLLAQGHSVGTSLVEPDWADAALEMLDKAKAKGVELLLPVDVVVANSISEDATTAICPVDVIPESMSGLDIGPASSELYARAIAKAKTVFWNGPMGVFELTPFASGTKQIAKAVAHNKGATTVIGGGDSVAAIKQFGLETEVSFISTGGGAAMQLVEGAPLPGVEALK